MSCPRCGLRQWHYDDDELTCKNGHRFAVGKKPRLYNPAVVIAATAAVTVPLTLALDLLIRSLT